MEETANRLLDLLKQQTECIKRIERILEDESTPGADVSDNDRPSEDIPEILPTSEGDRPRGLQNLD
jgi:hypothetical protein